MHVVPGPQSPSSQQSPVRGRDLHTISPAGPTHSCARGQPRSLLQQITPVEHGSALPGQIPADPRPTPACSRVHAFRYVVPSQPHSGSQTVVHASGRAVQRPSALHMPSGVLQYSVGAQSALLRQAPHAPT